MNETMHLQSDKASKLGLATVRRTSKAQFRPQITVENRRKRPRSKCMPQQPCELSWKRYGLERIGRKRNR
jgi:hypothetical protein